MRAGPEWFIWVETLGILSFAINAMIVAKGKNLSTFGYFLCAVAAALGGGTLRDILLGPSAQPFFWVAFPFYIVAIFVMSIAYSQLSLIRNVIARRDFVIKESAEAIAMASLGTLGAVKAFNILNPAIDPTMLGQAQLWILCAFFGAGGSAFGSIIRDIIVNEFPGALRPGVWVIEAAFLGCGVLVALRMTGVPAPWALLAGFLVTLILRVVIVFSPRRANPS